MAAGRRRFIPQVLEPAGPIPFGAFDRTPEELCRRKRQHNHRSEVAFATDLVKQDVTPPSEAGVASDIVFLPAPGLAVDAGLDCFPRRTHKRRRKAGLRTSWQIHHVSGEDE